MDILEEVSTTLLKIQQRLINMLQKMRDLERKDLSVSSTRIFMKKTFIVIMSGMHKCFVCYY